MGRKRLVNSAAAPEASTEPQAPIDPAVAAQLALITSHQSLVRTHPDFHLQLQHTLSASLDVLRSEGTSGTFCTSLTCPDCSWASERPACSMCASALPPLTPSTPVSAAAAAARAQLPVFIPKVDDDNMIHVEVCVQCSQLCVSYLCEGGGLAASTAERRSVGIAAQAPGTPHLLWHVLVLAYYAYVAFQLEDLGLLGYSSVLDMLIWASVLSALAAFIALMRDAMWLIDGSLPTRVSLSNMADQLRAAAAPFQVTVSAVFILLRCVAPLSALAPDTMFARAATAPAATLAEVVGADGRADVWALLTWVPVLMVLVDHTVLALKSPRPAPRATTAAAPAAVSLFIVAVNIMTGAAPNAGVAAALAALRLDRTTTGAALLAGAGAGLVVACDAVRTLLLDGLVARFGRDKVRKTGRRDAGKK